MESLTSDTDLSRKPPLCAATPLLVSLLPLIFGIVAARAKIPVEACSAATVATLAATLVCQRLKAARRVLFLGVVSFLVGFAGMFHANPDLPAHLAGLEPDEVTLSVRVERIFNTRRDDSASGTGRIMKVHSGANALEGLPVAFQLHISSQQLRKPAIGETLLCRGRLRSVAELRQPDAYQLYLRGMGIHLHLDHGRIWRLLAPPPPLERWRQRLYARAQTTLQTGCRSEADPGHVLASMLLGNRRLLTEERALLYRHTGTFHLFAVSGLHVGSVALCLMLLARLLRLPGMPRTLLAIAATWFYVWLTGSSPSAVRAGIMITVISSSKLLLRQPHLFPALAVSAWLVLLWDPPQLFDLGFQLSYAVVGAIVLIGLPMVEWLRARWPVDRPCRNRCRRWVAKGLRSCADIACVSLSASISSTPLIVQHFGIFTPGGLVAGIVLNPLTSLAVMAGCLSMMAGLPALPMLPLLGGWLAKACWPAIRLMEGVLKLCLMVPGSSSQVAWIWPPAGTLLVVACLALAWGLQRARQRGWALHPVCLLTPHAMIVGALLIHSRPVGT